MDIWFCGNSVCVNCLHKILDSQCAVCTQVFCRAAFNIATNWPDLFSDKKRNVLRPQLNTAFVKVNERSYFHKDFLWNVFLNILLSLNCVLKMQWELKVWFWQMSHSHRNSTKVEQVEHLKAKNNQMISIQVKANRAVKLNLHISI